MADPEYMVVTLSDKTRIELIGNSRVCIGRGGGYHDLVGLEDAVRRAIIPLMEEVERLQSLEPLVAELWKQRSRDWKSYIQDNYPNIAAMFEKENKDEPVSRARKAKGHKS